MTLDAYLLLPLAQIILCLGLAGAVLGRNWHSPTHHLFALFLLSLTLWGIVLYGMRASPDSEQALAWERRIVPLVLLSPVLFYHFYCRYTGTRAPKGLLAGLYLSILALLPLVNTDLFITGMQLKPFGYAAVFTPAMFGLTLIQYSLFTVVLIGFIRHYRTATDSEEKNRTFYFISGIITLAVGGAFDVLSIAGLPFYPSFVVGNIFFCVICAIAVLRHDLLDLHLTFRKSIPYILTAAIISLFFIFLLFIIIDFFLVPEGAFSPGPVLILVPLFVLLGTQLWGVVQRWADRLFHGYNYLESLADFNHKTQSLAHPAEIGATLVDLIAGTLHTRWVHVLHAVPPHNDWAVLSSTMNGLAAPTIVLGSRSPLVNRLKNTNIALAYPGSGAELSDVSPEEKENLQKLNTKTMFPLKTAERLVGVLILGPRSGSGYSPGDQHFIAALSSHAAISLENASLYADSLRRKENLERWLNSLHTCILVVKTDCTIEFMNTAARQRFGNCMVKCWEIRARDSACSYCPLSRDREATEIEILETIRGLDYDITISLSMNADGTASVTEVLRDITEHRRMESSLKEAEENFRNSLEQSPLGIRIITTEGKLLYANRAILDIYGYDSFEELKNTPTARRYTPQSYADHQKRKELRKLGLPVPDHYEIAILRKDGEIRYLAVSRKEVIWNGQRQFQSIYEDITEHRDAETVLLQNEAALNEAQHIAHIGSWHLDIETKMMSWSDEMYRIYGRDPQGFEPTHDSYLACVDSQDREEVRQSIAAAIRERTPYHSAHRIAWPDGSLRFVRCSAELTYDESGEPISLSGACQDITEQKKNEEKLHALSCRLIEIQEEERRLVAMELHDNLGPLVLANMTLDKAITSPPDEASSWLAKAKIELQEGLERVRDISLSLRPVALEDLGLLPALKWHFRRYQELSHLHVKFTHRGLGNSLPQKIRLTAYRIVQEALNNVVSHAHCSEVSVNIFLTDGRLTVRIEDNGIGFSPNEVALNCSGLSGMEERARSVGGKLLIDTAPSAGTRVIAELPVVRGEHEEESGKGDGRSIR